MLQFSVIMISRSLKTNTVLQVRAQRTNLNMKGHMRCIERNATIYKRSIHDREKNRLLCRIRVCCSYIEQGMCFNPKLDVIYL